MPSALDRLQPYVERAHASSGWSFSDLNIKHLGAPLPWDYASLVREYAPGRECALDMGTGGGEILAELRSSLPPRLIASEEWVVNAPIARERLAPLGADVVRCQSLQLPIAHGAFDLVLNRHEELEPSEVARVMRPGAIFVTQQVGRSNWQELRAFFPRMTDFGDLRSGYARGFARAGLTVLVNQEHEFRSVFPSLGEIVFMLAVAPWTIPKFDLGTDIDALLALENECGHAEGIVMTESRYVIVAERPSGV